MHLLPNHRASCGVQFEGSRNKLDSLPSSHVACARPQSAEVSTATQEPAVQWKLKKMHDNSEGLKSGLGRDERSCISEFSFRHT